MSSFKCRFCGKINDEEKPSTDSYEPKTPLQKSICAWKVLNGFRHNDRTWDKLNYSRCSKTMKDILDAFDGDHCKAIECMQDIVEDLKKKGLEFSLERAVKGRVAEWINLHLKMV